MQARLNVPPKIAIQSHPNYRVVQVSPRQGQVGMLLPHANFVVPDKAAIRDLKDIIQLYEKLKPGLFADGRTSDYQTYRETTLTRGALIQSHRTDDLPLFAKR
jgi:hypothetical protein